MTDQRQPTLSYRDAGVNIDAANEAIHGVKDIVKRTFDERVLQDIGSFGAMYSLDTSGMEAPVLVSSVDGVGTKLKLAFLTGKHDTVGKSAARVTASAACSGWASLDCWCRPKASHVQWEAVSRV